jgi:hypothetical protein
MTKEKTLIQEINKQKSSYTSPESAQDQANSLEELSTDIYTDSKRFIYELFQNADDASSESGKLDIQIKIIGQYLAISHNGEKFTEIDIESICSVGDGNKKGNENKTGFKGIGFKSVFSHSSYVIINSGNYCFRFDKKYWNLYWNSDWYNKQTWENQRKEKGKDTKIKMPWQIIPIWTDLPKEFAFIQDFNVSTIIRYDNINNLQKEIYDLLSNTQILLFLRSQKVKVKITDRVTFTVEKVKNGEITKLKKNGNDISEWLLKSFSFDVDDTTKGLIENDIRIPKKLRQSKRTEISFAVQLEGGIIKPADQENRLIFNYLPTSVNYDFPFLVNASFLTDAGRQNIHEDLSWNSWLFKQIPIKLFTWLSELAQSPQKNHILKLIPHTFSSHSLLKRSFDDGFRVAVNEIAFIPNKQGSLVKVSDAILDKTNISEFINEKILIDYISSCKKKKFSYQSLIPYLTPLSTLTRLGVKTFDISDLKDLFGSKIFSKKHKIEENFNLIVFLMEQSKITKELEEWKYELKTVSFLFNQNERLCKPTSLLFGKHTKVTDEEVIHSSVLTLIKDKREIYNWLSSLGVQEPTDSSFINLVIQQPENFVTSSNAIDTIRFIFNAYKKNIITDEQFEELRKVSLLTKKGSLKSCEKCYLSDFYTPELKLETIYDDDCYISESYVEGKDEKAEWKAFFLKMKVKQNISKYELIARSIISLSKSFGIEYFDIDDGYLQEAFVKPRGTFGYRSSNQISFVRNLSFLEQTNDNYIFAKIFWDSVIQSGEFDLSFLTKNPSLWYGVGSGYNSYSTTINTTYFEWYIKNQKCIPTTTGRCEKPENVFVNSNEITEVAGKYLPVFDCPHPISSEIREFLGFLSQLELHHYLDILTNISKDNALKEEDKRKNKDRVGLIYERLASMCLHNSDEETIKNWGRTNKLLAKDGKSFLSPSELYVVTVEGFKAKNLAFCDEKDEKKVKFLKLLGVSVIDKVQAQISSSQVEIKDLKNKLIYVLPLIAVVSVEKSRSKQNWSKEYNRLKNKLKDIRFFETTEIYLSYGNLEDKQKRSSWADGNNFYYVGDWYKPRVLDTLVEPLGKFLDISYAERFLPVLLSDTFQEGIEYLKEKFGEEAVCIIPNELLNPQEPKITVPNKGNRPYNQSDEDLGHKGELFVFEELRKCYSEKYEEPIEETSEGFKIKQFVRVYWRNKNEKTTSNHDFLIMENNVRIYIDSKATPYNETAEKIPFYLSPNEFALMESVDRYLIARVFNVTTHPSVKFIQLSLDNLE